VVLTERPLLIQRWEPLDDKDMDKQKQAYRMLLDQWTTLSAEKQEKMLSLSGMDDDVRRLLAVLNEQEKKRLFQFPNLRGAVKTDERQTRLEAYLLRSLLTIFMKYKWGKELYGDISRFNHECEPNAEYFRHGEFGLVQVNRDIKSGEEITLSYIGEVDGFDRVQRRKELKKWGFTCGCYLCNNEGYDKKLNKRMGRAKVLVLLQQRPGVDSKLLANVALWRIENMKERGRTCGKGLCNQYVEHPILILRH